MRGSLKFLVVAAVAAAFAAPATAAGFSGGGPPVSGGAGPVWIPPGEGGRGPVGPSGPNRGPGGAAPLPNPGGLNAGSGPRNPGGPNFNFRPPHRGAAPNFADHGHDGNDWRRRPRHYWFGGGPIFIPEPSGDYVYSDDDYDDGGDPSGCWVFRKAYDRAGQFLGWVHVDLCGGQ